MRVLAGQIIMSLAVLVFAALSLRVARALPGHAQRYAFAWAFTGWAFLVEGCNSLFHDLFSLTGFLGGPGSAAWDAVISWHPVLNHSRTFLLTTYCLVLSAALFRIARDETHSPRVGPAVALTVGGMLVGALVGWREPDFTTWTHYSAVAIFDIMELVAVMTVLVAGMMSGAMDRSLWVSLGLSGFILALSVLLFAALAQIDLSGLWSPKPWHLQTTKAVLQVSIVFVAIRHLRRIRRGRPVRGLLEAPLRPATLSMHG